MTIEPDSRARLNSKNSSNPKSLMISRFGTQVGSLVRQRFQNNKRQKTASNLKGVYIRKRLGRSQETEETNWQRQSRAHGREGGIIRHR